MPRQAEHADRQDHGVVGAENALQGDQEGDGYQIGRLDFKHAAFKYSRRVRAAFQLGAVR